MKNRIIIASDDDVEIRLYQMQDIKKEMKLLKAKEDLLKQEVIDGYFYRFESYRTKDGLELATYKSYKSERFQQTIFKDSQPELYKQYSQTKTIFDFRLK